MIKWMKALTLSEKIMVFLILMLLVGIIMRRDFVKKEAGDAIKRRIELINP